jgi:WD40 repeat protein
LLAYGATGPVRVTVATPDDRTAFIAAGHMAPFPQLWDLANGRPLGRPLSGDSISYGDSANTVAVSRDGTRLGAGGARSARLWDAATGRQFGQPLPHQGWITGVVFSPDGRRVLTSGTQEPTARLWKVAGGPPPRIPLDLDGEWTSLTVTSVTMAFRPAGASVVCVSRGAKGDVAEVYATDTGKRIGSSRSFPAILAVSPDARAVLARGDDRTARAWEVDTGRPLGPPLEHPGNVLDGVFSPDGKAVLTRASDGKARLWDLATGKIPGAPLPTAWPGEILVSLAVGPGARTVLIQPTSDSRVAGYLWDVATGKPIGPPVRTHYPAAFSPDGKIVLICGEREARLWATSTGEAAGPPLVHQGEVTAVAFSPDGGRVLTGSADHTARLWEAATGKPLGPPMSHPGPVERVAFGPDGGVLLTHSLNPGEGWFEARVWDAATGLPLGPAVTAAQPLGPPTRSQAASFVTLAFGRDGKAVLMGSSDGAVRRRPVPAPLAGGADRLTLWAQVSTGLDLDEHGAARILDAETWHDRRRRLHDSGGPPSF